MEDLLGFVEDSLEFIFRCEMKEKKSNFGDQADFNGSVRYKTRIWNFQTTSPTYVRWGYLHKIIRSRCTTYTNSINLSKLYKLQQTIVDGSLNPWVSVLFKFGLINSSWLPFFFSKLLPVALFFFPRPIRYRVVRRIESWLRVSML